MMSSPCLACCAGLAATMNVTCCSPCPDAGATLLIQFDDGAICHVHSGSARTVSVPRPPSEAMGCCGSEVVTWHFAGDGVSELSNDWSQAVARSATAASAVARAGEPERTRCRAAEQVVIEAVPASGGAATVGISNSEAIAVPPQIRQGGAFVAAISG